jgi:hypothetical protein
VFLLFCSKLAKQWETGIMIGRSPGGLIARIPATQLARTVRMIEELLSSVAKLIQMCHFLKKNTDMLWK